MCLSETFFPHSFPSEVPYWLWIAALRWLAQWLSCLSWSPEEQRRKPAPARYRRNLPRQTYLSVFLSLQSEPVGIGVRGRLGVFSTVDNTLATVLLNRSL